MSKEIFLVNFTDISLKNYILKVFSTEEKALKYKKNYIKFNEKKCYLKERSNENCSEYYEYEDNILFPNRSIFKGLLRIIKIDLNNTDSDSDKCVYSDEIIEILDNEKKKKNKKNNC